MASPTSGTETTEMTEMDGQWTAATEIDSHLVQTAWILAESIAARIITFSMVMLITIAANLFIVIATVADQKMRTTSNVLFASMAVADLFQGTINYMYAAVLGIHNETTTMGKVVCFLWCIFESSCGTVSLYHLLAIASHRLRSIVSPFRAQRKINMKIWNTITILLIWTLPFSLWSFHYALKNLGPAFCDQDDIMALVIFNLIVLYFLPFVGIIAVNVGTGVALRRMKTISDDKGGMKEEELRRHQKQRRGIMTLTIFNTVFLICWTPRVILWILANVFRSKHSLTMKYIIYYLYFMHSTLQPILVIAFNSNFKTKFKQLLKRRLRVHPLPT